MILASVEIDATFGWVADGTDSAWVAAFSGSAESVG